MRRFKINAPHIVHEIFSDEEAAIINLKTGNYYNLNPSGAEIWALIEKKLTSDQIIKFFAKYYETDSIDVANEISEFFNQLKAEDLIIEDEEIVSVETVEMSNNGKKNKFEKPLLERFADLQELLLLDPIHDVDEAGFPHKKIG
jgi:hypothetical protein